MALRGRRNFKEHKEEEKIIEISAAMQGSLTFGDPVNLKVNGGFTGDLTTKGVLTIGEKAVVVANISGDDIIIAGKVTGDITARKMLVLLSTAVLTGNIVVAKLNIVEGAMFQGDCQMGMAKDVLLGLDEVAEYLEINMDEIEALANSGKIPGLKNGDGWRFEKSQIDDWASSGKVK